MRVVTRMNTVPGLVLTEFLLDNGLEGLDRSELPLYLVAVMAMNVRGGGQICVRLVS